MELYWSRNSAHPIGKSVFINKDKYEVTVKVKESSSMSMPPISIIFATNRETQRSCNWEMSRKIYYNTGYLEFRSFWDTASTSAWEYWDKPYSDKKFQYIFSHEIGHEILLAYGGQLYSKKHKNTSTLITQYPLDGTQYPRVGEIDLMKYADENERSDVIKNFYQRSVAANEDVVSLLVISGISKK